jgi:hypothetical protein
LRINLLQQLHKVQNLFSFIRTVGTEHTVELLLTVKRDPGELTGVVVEEPGGQADALVGRHIREGVVVVGAVKAMNPYLPNDPLLHCPQGAGKTFSKQNAVSPCLS